jgi:two-component system response regulator HydG
MKVDVRIIAATNQDLQEAIAEKRFRQDLYYRLNVARFILPPLRDRREDVPLLVGHFLDKCVRKLGRRAELGEGVVDYLTRYEFTGNVRELENMIEQGVALAESGVIRLEDVVPLDSTAKSTNRTRSKIMQDVIDEAETTAIVAALREVQGNRERAAEMLGLSATTLWRKMKRLRLEHDRQS